MQETTITKLQLRPLNEEGHRTQSRVTVYTLEACPFCLRAKSILDDIGVKYQEKLLDGDIGKRRWVMEQSGGRKVLPQIFVEDRHLGGFYELKRFHKLGTLKLLISRPR